MSLCRFAAELYLESLVAKFGYLKAVDYIENHFKNEMGFDFPREVLAIEAVKPLDLPADFQLQ